MYVYMYCYCRPSMNYTMITWIYYLATEKVFVEMFPPILKFLRFDTFENLEELYAPVILKSFTISVSAFLIIILLPLASYKLLFIATYTNIYLRLKDLLQISGPALSLEREILNRYRKATPKEIKQFDDVCPVCLCDMVSARITPCYHLFHASCLHRCLKTNNTCPMCKRELTFGSVSTQ